MVVITPDRIPTTAREKYQQDFEALRSRNEALEAEVARLRKALECVRVYLMCGEWIFSKSPDEFIKAELEASDGEMVG